MLQFNFDKLHLNIKLTPGYETLKMSNEHSFTDIIHVLKCLSP